MSKLPHYLQYKNYEPANYPVLKQAGIVIFGVGLLLFLAILAQDSDDHITSGAQQNASTNVTNQVMSADNIPTLDLNPEDIEATSALVYDLRTGSVLFAKEPYEVVSLASITKLMTALLVTEMISETDTTITVTREAIAQYGNSGMRIGEQVTAENLNKYALLSSSNDAAYALAMSIGDTLFPGEGSQAFVDAMNVRATELNLQYTKFQNPTGLDVSSVESGAVGTAYDVSLLMGYILYEHPQLLAATRQSETLIYNQEGQFHRAANTNPLVNRIPNLLGSKTGFTDLAGGNLTIAYDAGFNRPIIITVLNSSFSGRFSDVEKLVAASQAALQQSFE